MPKFAQKYKTVDLFSEQGLECSHTFVNRLYDQYCRVPNERKKWKRYQLILAMED